jgi:hypothetical protein
LEAKTIYEIGGNSNVAGMYDGNNLKDSFSDAIKTVCQAFAADL